MIPLLAYGLIALWVMVLTVVLSTRFSTNAKVRASHYIAYSLAVVIAIGLAVYLLEPISSPTMLFLNLSLFAILAHIGVLFLYAYLFPFRHWKRRNRILGWFGVSTILCSTAYSLLLIELVKYLRLL